MDTIGWDVVYATSITKINQQLKKSMSKLVTTFQFQYNNISFAGEFDAWQIEPNGSDAKIRFNCPIKKGTLTISDKTGKKNVTDISGIIPEMELQLTFIDSDSGANTKKLVFNCEVKGKKPGDSTPGAVTVVNSDVTGKINPENDPATWGLLNNYLPDIFINNKEKLSYIFAQVNLALEGDESWLTPKKFIYAYKQQSGSNRGYLCVFTVLTERDISHLHSNLDGSLLNDTNDVFVLISNEMFLRHILQPALPGAYGHGAKAGNFVYKTTGGTEGKIVNNGHLQCGGKKWGLITYYPEITNFTILVDDSQIKSTAGGDFDITGLAGASVTFTVKSTLDCSYNKTSNKFTFSTVSHSTDYSKHIPWYDWVLGVIGGVIILGIVDLVVALVTDGIASSVSSGVSASGKLTSTSVKVVSWNGIDDVKIDNAGLSQSLYIRGTY